MKAPSRNPSDDNWTHTGYQLHRRGEFEQAIEAYDKAITLNPED